jgi:hypothetical protein
MIITLLCFRCHITPLGLDNDQSKPGTPAARSRHISHFEGTSGELLHAKRDHLAEVLYPASLVEGDGSLDATPFQ